MLWAIPVAPPDVRPTPGGGIGSGRRICRSRFYLRATSGRAQRDLFPRVCFVDVLRVEQPQLPCAALAVEAQPPQRSTLEQGKRLAQLRGVDGRPPVLRLFRREAAAHEEGLPAPLAV